MKDPLEIFVEKVGIDISKIKKLVCGKKYSAVMLDNGHIGVCANLRHPVQVHTEELQSADLMNTGHRIIINAYFNAALNYLNRYEKSGDIFTVVDFRQYKNILMIGLFKPLLEIFQEKKIQVDVFDLIKQNGILIPLDKEMEYIERADAIILSATTIFNRSFADIVGHTRAHCDVFLLGPSSTMHPELFKYKNVRKIFGSIFRPHDHRVIDAIRYGYGTKKFLPFGRKVCLEAF